MLSDIPDIEGREVAVLGDISGSTLPYFSEDAFFVQSNIRMIDNLYPVDALYFEGSHTACGRCAVSYFRKMQGGPPKFAMLDKPKPECEKLRNYVSQHPTVSVIDEVWNRRETPLAWLAEFGKELKCSPLTGLIALKHVMLHDVEAIYIAGYTFYHDGKKFPEVIGSHRLSKQIEWFRDVAMLDPRVEVDNKTKKVFM